MISALYQTQKYILAYLFLFGWIIFCVLAVALLG